MIGAIRSTLGRSGFLTSPDPFYRRPIQPGEGESNILTFLKYLQTKHDTLLKDDITNIFGVVSSNSDLHYPLF